MPRHVYRFLPGRENTEVNCFAFYRSKTGKPMCRALSDIYCLKEYKQCAFFATPSQAAKSAKRAELLQNTKEIKHKIKYL